MEQQHMQKIRRIHHVMQFKTLSTERNANTV